MREGLIDLHVHSTFSDGSKTPEELVSMAEAKGIRLLGITDHDTVDGVKKYLEKHGNDRDVKVVPGVEFETKIWGTEVHILGYFNEKKLDDISQRLEELKKHRMKEIIIILHMLNQNGVNVKVPNILKEYGGLSINSLAKYLIDHQFAEDRKDAFRKYLGLGGCAYVEKYVWNIETTLRNIHECEGVAVFAHPVKSAGPDELNLIVEGLVALGIEGIEIYHPDQDEAYSQKCKELAKKYKIFETGGSDFHGDFKLGITLGEVRGEKIPAVDFLKKRFDCFVLEGKGLKLLGK